MEAVFDKMRFAKSDLARAVQSLYGAVGKLDDFVEEHIGSMKLSTDASVVGTGRVLEGVKQGLLLGYAAPVVLMAAGQLLLGNPLAAIGAVASAAVLMNPVASTCAAIGAIWFGWKALSNAEQQALLDKLGQGFSLAVDVVRQVIDLALKLVKSIYSSREVEALKGFLVESATSVGRSLYSITGRLKDLIYPSVDDADNDRLKAAGPLMQVLNAMDSKTELEPLLFSVLKVDSTKTQGMGREGLELMAARELAAAASYSLPGARLPAYDDIVRIVAKQLKLPTRAELRTEELERAILFKVVGRSFERMSDEQKQRLTQDVEKSLRERGVDRKVTSNRMAVVRRVLQRFVGHLYHQASRSTGA